MTDVQQPLNRTAFEIALKKRKLTQSLIAERIGANSKSFSRWVNEGYIQPEYILDLAGELELDEQELSEIFLMPSYNVFFRKKFLGAVPDSVSERAIELARTLINLTYLNSEIKFFRPNLSSSLDTSEVADQIRKSTGIENFKSFSAVVSKLGQVGVEVAVIPFAKMGLHSEKGLECAFSATDGKRCVIFIDSHAREEKLIFLLCHELSHLFRPDLEYSKTEETFCNKVASELCFPESFFRKHDSVIRQIVEAGDKVQIISLVRSIQEQLGGELQGVVLRLKDLKYLSQKEESTGRMIGYAGKVDTQLTSIATQASPFHQLELNNKKMFTQFWNQTNIDSQVELRFFMHIKKGAAEGRVSSRKFSEIFGVDLAVSDLLISAWRKEFGDAWDAALK